MYSTYNEGKSVVAERFIKTLKNDIFKHMTTISKNIYVDSLNDIVNRYNNTVHKTIKMKPIDVTSDSYVEYNEILTKKVVNLKLMTMQESLSTKILLLKAMFLIGQKKFLCSTRLEIQFLGFILLVI